MTARDSSIQSGGGRAEHIVKFASESVGLKHGTGGSKEAVRCFVEEILYLTEKLDEIEEEWEGIQEKNIEEGK